MAATNISLEPGGSKFGVRCGRTLIRKTSLLHKIDPTAWRSSFADVQVSSIECRFSDNASDCRLPNFECRLESSAPPATSQSRATLGSISSSRCQITRALRPKPRACEFNFHERVLGRAGSRQPVGMSGGARRDRTDDLLLAKQALSQLSYGPSPGGVAGSCVSWLAEPKLARGKRPPSPHGASKTRFTGSGRQSSLRRASEVVGLGRFELPTSRLSSARSNQLSYKPGPGVSDQKTAIRNTSSSDYRMLITDS